jgi:antitoxin component YwqK of YwqJK toxin-antitoxin module
MSKNFLNEKKEREEEKEKGREYNYKGKLVFEGEYLNGERNGKGIEYYSNGKKNLKEIM